MQAPHRNRCPRILRAPTRRSLGCRAASERPASESRRISLQADYPRPVSAHLAAIGALRVVELSLGVDAAEVLAVGPVDRAVNVGLAIGLTRRVRRAAAEAAFAAGARRCRWTLHLADIAAVRAVDLAAIGRAAVLAGRAPHALQRRLLRVRRRRRGGEDENSQNCGSQDHYSPRG